MSFEARSIINGSKMRDFVGRHVSIFVKVENCSGQMLKGKSTDNHDLRISLQESINVRPDDWIEVIGVPAGHDAIRAKEVIQFYKGDEEFDVEAHNMLVQFVNLRNDFYQQG